MSLTASCACGDLSLTATDPKGAAACHCTECQKRTGSAFGIGTFFAKGTVDIKGSSVAFTRVAASGNKVENHFCPRCGTTLYWIPESAPNLIAVAGGAWDSRDWIEPGGHFYTHNVMKWVKSFDSRPKFDTNRADSSPKDSF